MSGETDLSVLLRTMQPLLCQGEYVFCTVERQFDPSGLGPIGLFYEDKGLTLMLRREQADGAGLTYTAVFRLITLSVHSSLEAVGFLAAIASHLAAHQISVNPVSAYYHDHLFVPAAQAEQAMQLLHELTRNV
ncbi:ACT domain-containing protein [Leptolyngbya sp. NK1-12]|uniref:ACT domain-containing protein n=1 Tax=Leptolyngbya sp. NK1-12 TaxID=2547451 RepID=A0AA96WAV3_9CYAN|nr:ACT domain-containing protein [Leptolyngbya sp. NK1-12]WNZ21658.1 ACT domain-containing protein [Leptolyngbya sp. NK1-12]